MAEATDRTTLKEEIEVGGSQLVDKVKALLHEGNVRQLKVIAADGDVAVEMPLTLGVLAGGAVTLAAPWLVLLAGVAALVKRVRIVVEREPEAEPTLPEPATAAKAPAEAGTA